MAFLDVAGGIGAGIKDTPEKIQNLSELIEKQRHTALQEHLEGQQIGMEERRTQVVEQEGRIKQEQEKRTAEQYKVDNQLIDPNDFLPQTGVSPDVAKEMIAHAKKNGFVENVGGHEVIRRKNVQPAMATMNSDLPFNLKVDNMQIDHLSQQLEETRTAMQKKQGDAQLQAQFQKLTQQKIAALGALEVVQGQIEKAKTIPAVKAAQIGAASREKVEGMKAAGATALEEKKASTQEKVAGIHAGAAVEAARIRAEATTRAAQIHKEAGEGWTFTGAVDNKNNFYYYNKKGTSVEMKVVDPKGKVATPTKDDILKWVLPNMIREAPAAEEQPTISRVPAGPKAMSPKVEHFIERLLNE
jgi:hypothetical protein